jgi:ribonuclease-3
LSEPAGPSPTIEAILGHSFSRPELLREAMTHRSATRASARGRGSNERLEFIGDRVLGLLMAEWLIERFPHEQEGDLGRRLALLVSQPVLAEVAETIGLSAALHVSPGEAKAGVRKRATVLADALEAALGALYLDAGLDQARGFIRRAWDGVMTALADPPKDAKTALQEWVQARGLGLPAYQVTARSGPPHAPVFEVTVSAGNFSGIGTAGSKRAAEQLAAEALLQGAGARGAKPDVAPAAAARGTQDVASWAGSKPTPRAAPNVASDAPSDGAS